MGPDMVLINSLGLDIILAPDGSTDFSDQHGISGSMAVYSMVPGSGPGIGMVFNGIRSHRH